MLIRSVDQGQTSTLTSTDITGTGTNPYTYQWMQKAPGDSSFSTINNANSPSYNFVTDSATTTGAWNFKLQVTDSADSPSTTTSKAVTVTVSPALATPTAYASLGTIDQGQTSSLTSTDITQTGTSPYTYQWMQQSPGDGSYYAISKAISSNYSFETSGSTITGSWSFELQVTDSVGTVVNSSPVTIMVSSALVAPTVSASADTLDQGQTSTLSSTDISTGTSLYTYQWFAKALGDGSYSAMSDASAPSYYFDTSKSTTTGAWSFMLQVTDATGVAVNSTAVVVTVNTAPAVNVSPTSQTIYVGQSQTLTATASYGSSDLTYQWYLNNNPIGTNSSTYNYTPDNAGSASIYVILIDSATNPQTATSNTAKIIINALTITTTAGTGGTITPSGIVSVNYGSNQTFNITPNTGYTTTQVTVNGNPIGSASSYTFTNIQSTQIITATFTLIPNSTSAPNDTPTPAHTTSPKPTTSPTPTATPNAAPTSSTPDSPNKAQSSNAQEITYGITAAVIAVAIASIAAFVLRKNIEHKN